jgi:hypothetical protein
LCGREGDAHNSYWKAWQAVKDDYDACIGAHYVALDFSRIQKDIALTHADRVQDDSVKEFYPSFYLNMGRSYEIPGNHSEAKRFYELAASLGYEHQAD